MTEAAAGERAVAATCLAQTDGAATGDVLVFADDGAVDAEPELLVVGALRLQVRPYSPSNKSRFRNALRARNGLSDNGNE